MAPRISRHFREVRVWGLRNLRQDHERRWMDWIGRLLTSASQFGDSVRSGPDNTDRAFLNQLLGNIETEVPMAKWLRIAKNKIKLHSAIGKTDHAGAKHGLSRYGTGLMEFEQEFQQGI